MAARGEFVHLAPRDAEAEGEVLGGLTHQQSDHRIGESFHDADDRCQAAAGLSSSNAAVFAPTPFALAKSANHSTILSE